MPGSLTQPTPNGTKTQHKKKKKRKKNIPKLSHDKKQPKLSQDKKKSGSCTQVPSCRNPYGFEYGNKVETGTQT